MEAGDNRWTVPQAAVWIRTRDIECVRMLDRNAKRYLSVADEVVPEAYDGSLCLRAALQAGRFAVWGRRRSSGENEFIPQAFWQGGGVFIDDERGVSASGPGLPLAWQFVNVGADDCQAHWPAPASLLAGGSLALRAALDRLADPPEDYAQWFLRHPAVRVTGLDGQGQRVAIDPAVFVTAGVLDRQRNAVATADGRLHWSAVTVERAAVAPAKALSRKSRGYDDGPILVELRAAREDDPTLSVQAWVYDNDKRIEGASVEGKVRRLQGKLAKTNEAN